MSGRTVQELIDELSAIKDRDRKVVIAGSSGAWHLVGTLRDSGHVVLWDWERAKERGLLAR